MCKVALLFGFILLVCSVVAIRLGFEVKRDYNRFSETYATVLNVSCSETCSIAIRYQWRGIDRFNTITRSTSPDEQIKIWLDEDGDIVSTPSDLSPYIFFSAGVGCFLSVVCFVIVFTKSNHEHGYIALI